MEVTHRDRLVMRWFVAIVIGYAVLAPFMGVPTLWFIAGFVLIGLVEVVYFRRHLLQLARRSRSHE